jgi:hypothetical protein
MFGLLRYDRKANGKEPERQKERTLEHGRIQNQIAANASEFFEPRAGLVYRLKRHKPFLVIPCHSERSEESLILRWASELRQINSQRCFAPLNMTEHEYVQLFNDALK